jgi:Cys-rich repeat protein
VSSGDGDTCLSSGSCTYTCPNGCETGYSCDSTWGCWPDSTYSGSYSECSASSDCPSGQTCFSGYCIPTGSGGCTSNSDCPSGQTCKSGACVKSTTTFTIDVDAWDNSKDCGKTTHCTENSCGSGKACDAVTGKCVSSGASGSGSGSNGGGGGCTASSCGSGYYCGSAGVCIQISVGGGCTGDSDCGSGEICTSSFCIPGCRYDSDCASTEVCTLNYCVPQSNTGGCTTNADCSGTLVCSYGVCVTAAITGEYATFYPCSGSGTGCWAFNQCYTDGLCACSTSSDCWIGEACINGECQWCTSSYDCDYNYYCDFTFGHGECQMSSGQSHGFQEQSLQKQNPTNKPEFATESAAPKYKVSGSNGKCLKLASKAQTGADSDTYVMITCTQDKKTWVGSSYSDAACTEPIVALSGDSNQCYAIPNESGMVEYDGSVQISCTDTSPFSGLAAREGNAAPRASTFLAFVAIVLALLL